MSEGLSKELSFIQAEVLEKIEKISTALVTNDPMIEIHCSSVHKALLQHEELVHLLPDSEIAKLMAGMKKWKNLKLVAEVANTRTRSKKVTADDL